MDFAISFTFYQHLLRKIQCPIALKIVDIDFP